MPMHLSSTEMSAPAQGPAVAEQIVEDPGEARFIPEPCQRLCCSIDDELAVIRPGPLAGWEDQRAALAEHIFGVSLGN